MNRRVLFGISLVAHLALAIVLGRMETKKARAATAISMSETKKKPEPPKPLDEPPPQEKARPEKAKKAKAAPAEAKPEAARPTPAAEADAALNALPDFGLSLSGGGSDGPGLAVAHATAPTAAASRPALQPEKVVKRPQALAPKADECEEPIVKAKPKNIPQPAYTEAGRAAGIEGKVRVELTIDERGQVVSARVLEGLGYGLDDAALDAARHATFEPATRCGKAVETTLNLRMRFELRS